MDHCFTNTDDSRSPDDHRMIDERMEDMGYGYHGFDMSSRGWKIVAPTMTKKGATKTKKRGATKAKNG
jgi:hypothetical protein